MFNGNDHGVEGETSAKPRPKAKPEHTPQAPKPGREKTKPIQAPK